MATTQPSNRRPASSLYDLTRAPTLLAHTDLEGSRVYAHASVHAHAPSSPVYAHAGVHAHACSETGPVYAHAHAGAPSSPAYAHASVHAHADVHAHATVLRHVDLRAYDCTQSNMAATNKVTEVKKSRSDDGEPPPGDSGKSHRKRFNYRRHPKPPFSYLGLMVTAIQSSPSGKLTLSGIHRALENMFPFFKCEYSGWKDSVRHNLSLNKCFVKVLKDETRPNGKGNHWTVNINNVPLDAFKRQDTKESREAHYEHDLFQELGKRKLSSPSPPAPEEEEEEEGETTRTGKSPDLSNLLPRERVPVSQLPFSIDTLLRREETPRKRLRVAMTTRDAGGVAMATRDAGITMAMRSAHVTMATRDAGVTMAMRGMNVGMETNDAGVAMTARDASVAMATRDAGHSPHHAYERQRQVLYEAMRLRYDLGTTLPDPRAFVPNSGFDTFFHPSAALAQYGFAAYGQAAVWYGNYDYRLHP